MSERYTATFDSLNPMRGVVVDEVESRYCLLPSLERAERAAATMNRLALVPLEPQLADVMTWRSTVTGKTISNESEGATSFQSPTITESDDVTEPTAPTPRGAGSDD